jgi:hypothetical protein
VYTVEDFGKISQTINMFCISLGLNLRIRIFYEEELDIIFLKMNITGDGMFQIDLRESSLLKYMGFSGLYIPDREIFASSTFCESFENLCQVESSSATWRFIFGKVMISDFSLGNEHSIFQTINYYNGETKLYSMGSNQYGQLGTSILAGVCYDHANNEFTCADFADQISLLDSMRPASITVPVEIEQSHFSDVVVFVEAGGFHNLILTADGKVWCFGRNFHGQCGFDINMNTDRANSIPKITGTRSDGFGTFPPDPLLCKPVLAASYQNCSASCEGIQPCGKWRQANQCFKCPFGGILPIKFSAGLSHSLVQTIDGRLWSFGSNSEGQLIQSNSNLGNINPNAVDNELKMNFLGDDEQLLVTFQASGDVTLLQTYRLNCAPGSVSVDGRSPCDKCESGSYVSEYGVKSINAYSDDQSVQHPLFFLNKTLNKLYLAKYLNCNTCNIGKYASSAESTQCNVCSVGSYALSGASVCHLCPEGTISPAADVNRSSCNLCPAGKSSLRGTSSCQACQPGSFSDQDGSSFCFLCKKGNFANASTATKCFSCDIGLYLNFSGGTACFNCPANSSTAESGATDNKECLSLCEAGKFGNAAPGGNMFLGLLNCKSCEAGKFSNSSRQDTDQKGATSCESCISGF